MSGAPLRDAAAKFVLARCGARHLNAEEQVPVEVWPWPPGLIVARSEEFAQREPPYALMTGSEGNQEVRQKLRMRPVPFRAA